jgi:hypothetical protein
MSPSRFHPTLLLLALALPGCAARGPVVPTDSANLLTREQLAKSNYQNAYDAVSALRSNWLSNRGRDSFVAPSQVLVYLDGVRLGGVDELRHMPLVNVSWLRRYSGVEATGRWGMNHAGGVIYVSTAEAKANW